MNPRVRALYKIDARPDGPARARRIVLRECSQRVSPRMLEDVELLVSELVTNRIVHGDLEDDDTVTLDLGLNSTLRCAVTDGGPARGERGARPAYGSHPESSQGLRLVGRMADRWGVQRTRSGTRVWFETATT